MSTYLFNFVGGAFRSISYDNFDGPTVPMTIYCSESKYAKAVEQQREIFIYCKRGIEFYEQFFRYKYPFHKFAFIFCPEYAMGAMEFPGSVTFNDEYIYEGKPSINEISERGNTITHELSHMWFGNLVTMRWWNDLWLNESFADFVSYLAQASINP